MKNISRPQMRILDAFIKILSFIFICLIIGSFILKLIETPDYFYLSQIPVKEYQLQLANLSSPFTLKLVYEKSYYHLSSISKPYIPAKFAIKVMFTGKRVLTFSDLIKTELKHFLVQCRCREMYHLFPLNANLPKIVRKMALGMPIQNVSSIIK